MPERIPTRVVAIDPVAPDAAIIAEAAALIRAGRLVAFPTETVYGLGANATDEAAVLRIFAAKERARDDPLIVHLAEAADLASISGRLCGSGAALAAAFWPGPLTLVVSRGAGIPATVSAGLDTVAVRVPAHPVARALIRAAGVPIAAPSANRFMRTSATTAAHVFEDLDGRIDLILDGGPAAAGLESTVVVATDSEVRILRQGAITAEEIERVLGFVPLAGPGRAGIQPSPGMMAKHYAPRTPLVLINDPAAAALARAVGELRGDGRHVGVLASSDDLAALGALPNVTPFDLGPADNRAVQASRLFAGLRALDAAGVDVILARTLPDEGLGRAINDRLRRAATTIVGAAGPAAD